MKVHWLLVVDHRFTLFTKGSQSEIRLAVFCTFSVLPVISRSVHEAVQGIGFIPHLFNSYVYLITCLFLSFLLVQTFSLCGVLSAPPFPVPILPSAWTTQTLCPH